MFKNLLAYGQLKDWFTPQSKSNRKNAIRRCAGLAFILISAQCLFAGVATTRKLLVKKTMQFPCSCVVEKKHEPLFCENTGKSAHSFERGYCARTYVGSKIAKV